MIIEAEECSLGGSLYTSDSRKGFSGEGYVTGFYGGSADQLEISFEIETNQHYDITICAAADAEISNHIEVNGKNFRIFNKRRWKFYKNNLLRNLYERGRKYNNRQIRQ